jgi:peptidoglycan/LPS O-acetylase OafA/YrhL
VSTLIPPAHDRHSERLYWLDWLRVLAVLGVFLFHAVHPFDLTPWHIKNAEQSAVVQPVIILLAYYAVQWPASLAAKLLFVVAGSFCVTLGLYELLLRRVSLLGRLFGMKRAPGRRLREEAAT